MDRRARLAFAVGFIVLVLMLTPSFIATRDHIEASNRWEETLTPDDTARMQAIIDEVESLDGFEGNERGRPILEFKDGRVEVVTVISGGLVLTQERVGPNTQRDRYFFTPTQFVQSIEGFVWPENPRYPELAANFINQ